MKRWWGSLKATRRIKGREGEDGLRRRGIAGFWCRYIGEQLLKGGEKGGICAFDSCIGPFALFQQKQLKANKSSYEATRGPL
ncbi:hypothetical protein LXL04_020678 [Taraxacum kok-saghyz]